MAQFHIKPIRHIGAGGIGTVDEVEVVQSTGSPPVGTRLARKQLGPQWTANPVMRDRFEREIELLGTMHHPNIVTLVGVSISKTERWYVMPLYSHSVRDLIRRHPQPRDPIEVARFGASIADALQYAHGLGFCHRDLKPENVLLRGSTEFVVADWGIGQFVHKTSKVLDLTVAGLGTAYYCSVKQWADGRDDEAGDIYSLGVMLAELARGTRLPIEPVGAGIRVDVAPSHAPGGTTFNAIIWKMTGFVPSMRHRSMAEVAQALRGVG